MLIKLSLALTLVVGLTGLEAMAQPQGRGTQQEQDACSRDVRRFCRKVIEQGDMVILNCLQQNRKQLSKGCQKVLSDHGQ